MSRHSWSSWSYRLNADGMAFRVCNSSSQNAARRLYLCRISARVNLTYSGNLMREIAFLQVQGSSSLQLLELINPVESRRHNFHHLGPLPNQHLRAVLWELSRFSHRLSPLPLKKLRARYIHPDSDGSWEFPSLLVDTTTTTTTATTTPTLEIIDSLSLPMTMVSHYNSASQRNLTLLSNSFCSCLASIKIPTEKSLMLPP